MSEKDNVAQYFFGKIVSMVLQLYADKIAAIEYDLVKFKEGVKSFIDLTDAELTSFEMALPLIVLSIVLAICGILIA